MSKKNKPDTRGFVFSTDPSFRFEEEQQEEQATLPPEKQKLIITLDTRHRGGKTVTLVKGFVGQETDLEELGKKIKQYCGTGGSVKEGEIIIQGDQRPKIKDFLTKNNYPFRG